MNELQIVINQEPGAIKTNFDDMYLSWRFRGTNQ